MLAKLKEIISDQLDIAMDEVTEDKSFKDDFNADSLDLVELIMAIEDEFGIEISDEDFDGVKTVGDALDFLEKRV
ncbi:MAG: acyl carrier protein [Clostridia bacterium]|nr:acyl carrier protein [Clostridia bacterium]MBR2972840.1 acyl carrier protein [Clostridia bacterium]MBR3576690.1 acyl carrier protein [Clostridia bacterium]